MINLTIFFLLSSLALISVTDCQSTCAPEEECLKASECEFFTVEREKLNNLTKNSPEWRRQLTKLKSLVCNVEERKICCNTTTTNTTTTDTTTDTTETASPGDAPNYRPSLDREECGELNSHAGFILGGNDTRLGEYPFLALLGRRKKGRKKGIFWHCGGTLINKWYVISAAHCGPTVDFVRLGEWEVVDPDIYKRERKCIYYNENSRGPCEEACPGSCQLGDATVDCDKKLNKCSKAHQDIAVAEVKSHQDYGKTPIGLAINDIMLLKLSRPVEYNEWVKPICLPS